MAPKRVLSPIHFQTAFHHEAESKTSDVSARGIPFYRPGKQEHISVLRQHLTMEVSGYNPPVKVEPVLKKLLENAGVVFEACCGSIGNFRWPAGTSHGEKCLVTQPGTSSLVVHSRISTLDRALADDYPCVKIWWLQQNALALQKSKNCITCCDMYRSLLSWEVQCKEAVANRIL